MEEKEGSYITISGLTKEGIEILLAALYEQKRLREAKQEGMSFSKIAYIQRERTFLER